LGVRYVFSVYRAIWDRRLEAIQRGRDIRVSLAAIKAYLKEEASRPGRKGRRQLRE
jgi:DNA-binding transcriptional MerR regulator